jgi:hypothetical protein
MGKGWESTETSNGKSILLNFVALGQYVYKFLGGAPI